MRARIFPDEASASEQKPFLSHKANALLATWDRNNRRGGRGPSNRIYSAHSIKEKPSSVWTVRWPKRMMFTILGVFLAIPLLIFGWKETHGVSSNHQMVDSGVRPRLQVDLTERDRLRATWMEDGVAEDVEVATTVPTTETNKATTSPIISIPTAAQTNATTEINTAALIDSTNKTIVPTDSSVTLTVSDPNAATLPTLVLPQNPETNPGLRGALEKLPSNEDAALPIDSIHHG